MIAAMTLLLACQLAGEIAARGLGIPVPGPVLGMALLFVVLLLRRTLAPVSPEIGATPLGGTAKGLLAHLSILFVPAGVGIIRYAGDLSAHGWALIAALVGSTALTLAVTAGVFRMLSRDEDAA